MDTTAERLIHEAIVAEVDDHLHWNVKAYGKAWTGEGEDTEFIVAHSARKALAALKSAGYTVVAPSPEAGE